MLVTCFSFKYFTVFLYYQHTSVILNITTNPSHKSRIRNLSNIQAKMKNCEWFADLAQIRALVESTGMLGGSTCPSCEMPFDKGKKRRLIDSCGHERCYSCLFRSEACPLCLRADFNDDDGLEGPFRDGFVGSSGPMSILAPTDGWIDESSTVNSLCGSPRPRTKVTTRANLPSRVMHVSIIIAESSNTLLAGEHLSVPF